MNLYEQITRPIRATKYEGTGESAYKILLYLTEVNDDIPYDPNFETFYKGMMELLKVKPGDYFALSSDGKAMFIPGKGFEEIYRPAGDVLLS